MEYTFQILLANETQFRRNMIDLTFANNDEYKFKKSDITNYKCAYYGQVKAKGFKDVPDVLFQMFNINHPKDYTERSLSVGDIVIVNGMMFICCGIGFKEIEFDLVENKPMDSMFIVALQVGGIQGQPDITYADYRRVVANTPDEAVAKYNKIMNCSFFYGKCIKEIADDECLEFELIE